MKNADFCINANSGIVYLYLSKLPWIFPGAPLTFNGAPGNIQGGNIVLTHLGPLCTPAYEVCHQASLGPEETERNIKDKMGDIL